MSLKVEIKWPMSNQFLSSCQNRIDITHLKTVHVSFIIKRVLIPYYYYLQSRLVQYLMDTLHMHNAYSFGYFFCEILNFINVVCISINYKYLYPFRVLISKYLQIVMFSGWKYVFLRYIPKRGVFDIRY